MQSRVEQRGESLSRQADAVNLTQHSAPRVLALDGLRGIAACAILVMHAFPAQLFWAWSFVDLFFVLSGFLITGILLRVDVVDAPTLGHFWMRRVIRIWPVYFVALLMSLAIWGIQSGGEDMRWWRCLVFLQFTESFGATGIPEHLIQPYAAWFRHSWSLAVEEQFYVLWPVLLVLLRRNRAALALACVALLVVSAWMRSQGQLVILLATRCDGLALGALLAVMCTGTTAPRPLAQYRTLFAAALFCGAAVVVPYLWVGYLSDAVSEYNDIGRYGNWTMLVSAFALLHFGFVGLLLDGALPRLGALLSRPSLVLFGALSYGIYMYSGPVPELLRRIGKRLPWDAPVIEAIAGILATLLVAWLSRVFMERPLERFKVRFPLKPAPQLPAPARDTTTTPVSGLQPQ